MSGPAGVFSMKVAKTEKFSRIKTLKALEVRLRNVYYPESNGKARKILRTEITQSDMRFKRASKAESCYFYPKVSHLRNKAIALRGEWGGIRGRPEKQVIKLSESP